MRRKGLVLGIAILAALASRAVAASLEDFAGVWILDKARSADVEKAIEACVARMNFVTRAVARPRLKKTNIPYERISIATDASTVTVVYGAKGKRITTPSDGKVASWTREDGETFQISHALAGSKLVEVFRSKDGQKRTDFSVSDDRSTLSLEVTVSSPRLPEPLAYRLVYRHQE